MPNSLEDTNNAESAADWFVSQSMCYNLQGNMKLGDFF